MIKLTLTYPPSVNKLWRNVGARTLLSRAGRAYRQHVLGDVLEQGRPRVEGRLSVSIVLLMPDRMRRDLDNVAKAILDALAKAGVYSDDSQIDRLTIVRGPVLPPGRALVEIEELE